MRKPTIAAVNGAAAGGGGGLALACDLRIASDSASFGLVFNRIGLHPDWGGAYFLPRIVGAGKALELILSGDIVDANEGRRLGIFNRVVPGGTARRDRSRGRHDARGKAAAGRHARAAGGPRELQHDVEGRAGS